MSTIEKALNTLEAMSAARQRSRVDARVQLVVTLIFIGVVLSVPVDAPERLVWMLAYPIVMAEASGVGYLRLFVKSLWVLPLIMLIGIFNPIIDHQPMWRIGELTVSRGWVMFIGITLRGLLALQALLLLIASVGFNDVCRSLRAIGLPKVLCTQLMMLYRYMSVLLTESLTMRRARESRGYGRKSYPLKMWGTFVGQLLLRTVNRARHISDAMEARGFDGDFPWQHRPEPLTLTSWAYLICWTAAFAAMRFIDFSQLFNILMQ